MEVKHIIIVCIYQNLHCTTYSAREVVAVISAAHYFFSSSKVIYLDNFQSFHLTRAGFIGPFFYFPSFSIFYFPNHSDFKDYSYQTILRSDPINNKQNREKKIPYQIEEEEAGQEFLPKTVMAIRTFNPSMSALWVTLQTQIQRHKLTMFFNKNYILPSPWL